MIGILMSSITRKKVDLSELDVNIVFDGDSLYRGIGATASQDWPNMARVYLEPLCRSLTFNSFGVSGQNIDEMLADASTQIDVLYDPAKLNIIVFGEAVNGILNDGFTAQYNADRNRLYATQRKIAGWEYRFCTIDHYARLPYPTTGEGPNWPDRLQAYIDSHTSLLTNKGDITRVVDIRRNEFIGGGIAQNINSIYFDDTIHLKTAGYQQYSNEFIDQAIMRYFK